MTKNSFLRFKFNNDSFLPSLIIYGAGTTLNKFVPVFLVPIFTSVYTTEEYGLVDILTSISFFIAVLGTIQLESSVSRFYYEAETFQKKQILVSTSFWVVMSTSLFIIFLVLVNNGWIIMLLGKGSNIEMIMVAAISILIFNLYSILAVVIRFEGKPLTFSIISFGQLIITLTSTIILVVHIKIGVVGVFYGQAIGYLFGLIVLCWQLKNYFILRIDIKLLISQFSFSVPLIPGVFVSWINSHGVKIILLGFISLGQLGVLASAMKVASIFMILENSIRLTWSPFFWKNFKLNNLKVFHQIYVYVVLALTLSMVFYTLFIEDLYKLVIDSSYWSGINLLIPLGFGFALNMIIPIVSMGAHIMKKTIYNSIVQLIATLFYVAMLLILTPVYGLLGIALSFLMSRVLLIIMFWLLHEKMYSMQYSVKYFLVSMLNVAFIVSVMHYYDIPFELKVILAMGITTINVFATKKYQQRYKLINQ